MLWPEVVFVDKIDDLSTTANRIVAIARDEGGFNGINRDNIEEIILNPAVFALEELGEIIATPNEPKSSKQYEDE